MQCCSFRDSDWFFLRRVSLEHPHGSFSRAVLRTQPVACALASVGFLLALIAGSVLLVQRERLHIAQTSLAELRRDAGSAAAARQKELPATLVPLDLPPFHSTSLVKVINETAEESGLVLDEIGYALDENDAQPFLRYRITMTVAAAYPLVRSYAASLNTKVPHLALDAITCEREDITVTVLTCDLALSAFFGKNGQSRGFF